MGLSLANKFTVSELQVGVFLYLLRKIFSLGNMQILPIFNINDLQLACFMYSATHGLLPFYFINMFQVNSCIHTHNTRQKDKTHQIGHKLNLRKFTVTIAGPVSRNAIWAPSHNFVRTSNSHSKFMQI